MDVHNFLGNLCIKFKISTADFAAWSPYNLVLANPVRFIDPDGRAPIPGDPPVKDDSGLLGIWYRAQQVSQPISNRLQSLANDVQQVAQGVVDGDKSAMAAIANDIKTVLKG